MPVVGAANKKKKDQESGLNAIMLVGRLTPDQIGPTPAPSFGILVIDRPPTWGKGKSFPRPV